MWRVGILGDGSLGKRATGCPPAGTCNWAGESRGIQHCNPHNVSILVVKVECSIQKVGARRNSCALALPAGRQAGKLSSKGTADLFT